MFVELLSHQTPAASGTYDLPNSTNNEGEVASKKGVIYMYRFPQSDKYYIGQSWDIKKRHKKHITGNDNQVVGKAHLKYGPQPYLILKVCYTQEEMNACEKAFIKMYNAMSNGYNITEGGKGGKRHKSVGRKISKALTGRDFSAEHRKNLSISATGRPQTDETKNKIAAANTGKVLPQETRDKIRNSLLGKSRTSPTAATRQKMRIAKLGKSPSAATRIKIAKRHKGRKLTLAHRQNISKGVRKMLARKAEEAGLEPATFGSKPNDVTD